MQIWVEEIGMQTDSVALLRSAMYRERVLLCQEITRQTGKEAGFHCWTNSRSTIFNHPIEGGEHSMHNHLKGDTGFLYADNTGFYEGADAQILVFTHTHPGTGRNVSRPRIPEIFPSFVDILSLFRIARQNLIIGDELHVDQWVNPIAVIVEKEREDVFVCQFNRFLVEKLWAEDQFAEHVADTLNTLFQKWYPTKQQSVVWHWGLIVMHNNMGFEVTPPFVTSSRKRCLEFYASLGLICTTAPLSAFDRSDALAMFTAPAIPESDADEEDSEDDDGWEYDDLRFG